jgi:hypothetical protein
MNVDGQFQVPASLTWGKYPGTQRTEDLLGHRASLHSWKREMVYRGADKPLDRPGRKQATATEDFELHISYL